MYWSSCLVTVNHASFSRSLTTYLAWMWLLRTRLDSLVSMILASLPQDALQLVFAKGFDFPVPILEFRSTSRLA